MHYGVINNEYTVQTASGRDYQVKLNVMKATVFFIICIFCTILNAQDTKQNPFPIKSGIVEYSFYGSKTGKGTLWYDDFGLKYAMYTEVTTGNKTTKGWTIATGGYQYTWESAKLTEGIKTKNPMLIWANEEQVEGIESFNESLYLGMGMKRYGNEVFLKRQCKSFTGNNGKVLIWQGIIMRLDLKEGGRPSYQAATSIKTNVAIDAKVFRIPANVKFTEKP